MQHSFQVGLSVPSQETVYHGMLSAEANSKAESKPRVPVAVYLNSGLKINSKQSVV